MSKFKKSKRRNGRNGMKKVKEDIKWLKNNVEFKFIDTVTSAVEVNTTSTTLALNLIADGPLVNERSGEEVTARRIAIRGTFLNNHGTPVDCTVRVIVWRKLQTNGATAAIGDVLATPGNTLAFRNMLRKENVVVYWDHTFAMDKDNLHTFMPFKFVKKLDHQCRFNGAAGTQAAMFRNGIYITVLSDVSGTTDNPQANIVARYSYCDS